MRERTRENLTELLQRFMEASAVPATDRDIQAGERILEAHPAPAPDSETITFIKAQMAMAGLRHHQWRVRVFGGSLATAAAIITIALIGLLGRGPMQGPAVSFATLLPASIWESDNLAADDLELVHFTSEIRQIEAQMQALDADESDTDVNGTLEDLENQLLAIETELWKG